MNRTIAFCSMGLAAAGLWLMPAAHAQGQDPNPRTPVPSAPAKPADISDAKLDSAAAAARDVFVIRSSYEQKLSEASGTEKERLTGEANRAMEQAVAKQGLSVEEYQTIIQVAQSDPVVRGRLMERLNK
ncbi:MAG: DUF4168 domain-containing protein [Enhydrobacter sp.]|nr:MAG: DUF4168 domain-containing protein [Enhydrobacter sp.]